MKGICAYVYTFGFGVEEVKELMKKCSISPARQESERYNQFKFNLTVSF